LNSFYQHLPSSFSEERSANGKAIGETQIRSDAGRWAFNEAFGERSGARETQEI
jgi:hypothetical protein